MSARLAVALAVLAALLALAGCGAVGRSEPDASIAEGRQLFVEGQGGKQSCGSCHALEAAGTTGTIGPDLDAAYAVVREEHGFDESTLRDVVRGQIAYPVENPGTVDEDGNPLPGMPANLVTGDAAEAVAAFVARCAGNADAPGCSAAGGGEATGDAAGPKAVFTQSCGSCHVLADAGTSGTIGPNLDEAELTVAEAAEQIRNGGGGMPAFEGQLSEEQIRALAEYVVEAGGR